jgi:hypothetical protein
MMLITMRMASAMLACCMVTAAMAAASQQISADETSAATSIPPAWDARYTPPLPATALDEHLLRHILVHDPVQDVFFVLSQEDKILTKWTSDGRIDTVAVLPLSRGEHHRISMNSSGTSLLFWPSPLGEVYRFDLADSTFRRLDDTLLKSFMHQHLAVVMPGDRIHAIGGYGFWEYRNMLLYFDPISKGWLKAETTGDPPPPPFFGAFAYLPDRDAFLVLSDVDEEQRGTRFEAHLLSLGTMEWSHAADLVIPDKMNQVVYYWSKIGNVNPVLNTHYDLSTGWLSLGDGSHFLDTRSMTILTLDPSLTEDLIPHQIVFSPLRNSWLVVGPDVKTNAVDLIIRDYQYDADQLIAVSRPDAWRTARRHITALASVPLAWSLSVLLLVMTLVTGFRRTWNSLRRPPSVAAPIQILTQGGSAADMLIHGQNIQEPDESWRRLVAILLEMKQRGQSDIPLTKVDQQLYPVAMLNQSHITKRRTKLMETVNELAGSEILQIERGHLDRRYKRLQVRLDMIRVSESNSNTTS